MYVEVLMLLLGLLAVPIITCGILWLFNDRRLIGAVSVASSFILFALSCLTAYYVTAEGGIGWDFANEILFCDSLSGYILLITTFLSLLASIYSTSYMEVEYRRGEASTKKLKLYYSLLHAFILTMVLALTTQNMGLMWIAVEATTLASAFLVGFYNNKKSIEAAWKYIIICSVGIAFALLGIIFLYYSSIQTMGHTSFGLNWQFLFQNAGKLQGGVLKIAFIFILVGFGTKAGLAPMHTWLPDAHSQAPSPISALLSGVLLNTAMYGVLRVLIIVNKSLGSSTYTGRLLIALGILSIAAAAFFILVQADFKRTLAYSSIEHMGIIALGLGLFTPMAIFASLYHILNHALTKSMLFFASGNIYLKFETKQINKVNGVLKVMPVTGIAFLLGIFAITGMPPFGTFYSELGIIIEAFKGSNYLVPVLLLLFIVLIFAGFMTRLVGMLFGKPQNEEVKQGEMSGTASAVLILLLVLVFASGLYLPAPLKLLMESSAKIISGS